MPEELMIKIVKAIGVKGFGVPEKLRGLAIPTNSIKAPTVVSPQPEKPVESLVGGEAVEKKLETIKRLLDRGLITEEEAAAKRVKLLQGL